VASAELIKINPASAQRMADTLTAQPQKVTEAMSKFSAEFDKALGLVRQ
jgi:hypothetical protein